MGQNTVNCVTVGWQAVCYFNSCPFISFHPSLTNFLSFLAPLICSHISYPCALCPPHPPPAYISFFLPSEASHSLFSHPLLVSLSFILSILIFPHHFLFYTSALRISCLALQLSTQTGRTRAKPLASFPSRSLTGD